MLSAEETFHFLLRKGLQLVLDGVNPQMAETTMKHYIPSGKHLGKALLQRCIVVEGVLTIQNGINPKIIKELLLSLFGEDSYAIYEREYGDGKADHLKAFSNGLNGLNRHNGPTQKGHDQHSWVRFLRQHII